MPRDSGGERWWNCIRDLERLLGARPAEEVIQREALDNRRLTHGNGAVLNWVYRQGAVASHDRPCLHAAKPAVRDRLMAGLESRDPADYTVRMIHRRHVQQLAPFARDQSLRFDPNTQGRQLAE